MKTITRTVYEYDELPTAQAKARARDWLREAQASDSEMLDSVIEDAATILEMLGIELATHGVQLMNGKTRQDPNIWYRVSYSQGDGAAFDGTYRYRPGAHRKIRQHAPQDTELHAIADELRNLERSYGYKLTATIRARDLWTEIADTNHPTREITTEDYNRFRETMRQLGQWIYHQLCQEDEYQNSDEQIEEAIRANGYTFTEDGTREG